jgi:serine/threonine-protein kinase RsbW
MTVECSAAHDGTTRGFFRWLEDTWPHREVSLRRTEEVAPLLDELTAALADAGFSPEDCFAARLALEEAVVNGLRHGNGGDPTKRVRVGYRVGPVALLADVEDEGPGFDPDAVPDPTLPENRDRPGGRGLLLMRHYMTWVRYRGRGNRVTLCKRPTPRPPAA